MIDTILAATEAVKSAATETVKSLPKQPIVTFTRVSIVGVLVFLCYGFIFALVIIGLVRLVKFLGTANKEMKLTRMEMGKLAEEVHLLQQKLKDTKENDSAAQ
ncbi:hypothetical protein ES707_17151 [subsurface metagenome]